MQATKVEVSPELLSESLTSKHKAELRRQRVIELINSKPTGAQIKLSEFAAATDMSTGSVHDFLKRMAKRGYISIEKLSPHELTYHALSDKPRHEWKTITPHEHNSVVPHEAKAVVDMAMRFFWEAKSDSLHDFVEWARQQ